MDVGGDNTYELIVNVRGDDSTRSTLDTLAVTLRKELKTLL